jgi:hypothetical protein
MKCAICGMEGALVRECEIEVAKITRRAHVDCGGHGEYCVVSHKDIEESEWYYSGGAMRTGKGSVQLSKKELFRILNEMDIDFGETIATLGKSGNAIPDDAEIRLWGGKTVSIEWGEKT